MLHVPLRDMEQARGFRPSSRLSFPNELGVVEVADELLMEHSDHHSARSHGDRVHQSRMSLAFLSLTNPIKLLNLMMMSQLPSSR